MQIVPFFTHYQLVYANFDFSSFSLISYNAKRMSYKRPLYLLPCKSTIILIKRNILEDNYWVVGVGFWVVSVGW